MKWFDNWFEKKCKQAWEAGQKRRMEEAEPTPTKAYGSKVATLSGSTGMLETKGMKFTVYKANGGHVIEHTEYDINTDRRSTGLHVIPADKDLGEGIAQILTFEMLKK